MTVIGPRKYAVTRGEFPLAVTIARRNTGTSAATAVIVGHVRVVKNGVVQSAVNPSLTTDTDGTISYRIPAPTAGGALTVTQTLSGFFAAAAPDEGRFEIAMTAASGDVVRASIRKPTLNPSVAHLTFVIS